MIRSRLKNGLNLSIVALRRWIHPPTRQHALCLPLKPYPGGGVYSFIRTFRSYLDGQGYDYTDDLAHDCQVMLIAAWTTDYSSLCQARRWNPDLRIVHRVDGSARAYGRFDGSDERLAQINALADVTVFQSEFSRWVTTTRYPLIKVDGPTIYNPVDTGFFTPEGERSALPTGIKVCSAVWSTNRMKGIWQLPMFAAGNPDVQFVLCGRHDELPALANLHVLGAVNRKQMARVMRSCDLFLNLSLNEACPNVVIEALASGLPVLYVDSGGTPELVGESGLPVTVDTFRTQFERISSDLKDYQRRARERAVTRYDVSIIGPQYLQLIDSLRP
jgi:glycosyltransferase involved in cell wall biosynthesis